MHSSLIGKVEKAKRYAEERERRIKFESLSVRFRGENDDHTVQLDGAHWSCTCDFFDSWNVCSTWPARLTLADNGCFRLNDRAGGHLLAARAPCRCPRRMRPRWRA